MVLAVLLVCFFCVVTAPLTLGWQAGTGAAALALAIAVRRRGGRHVSLAMMALSLSFSSRYLYWRLTSTLPIGLEYNSLDLFMAFGLVGAEIYAFLILVLGYFQVLWPLGRMPAPLPEDSSQWPMVDIYIPTYNEPLKVVRPTILAALDIDWPADKFRVYVLDDGRREEFRQFCAEVGVTHLTRPDNKHAKAGNINHALTQTQGEFIAIFDCDHIPTRSFLQLTMGTLVADSKMALIQTPHHFFSPDPFERNLRIFRRVPNEGELFYGLLQDGNDFWNATFFCGSCAVIRRTAMMEIGGIAVETVTEDAHTALRLHSRGWHSSYINIPQAAGLATESLSAHVGQRIRWARGMAQILRIDNPLLIPGLSLGQRLCYFNAMLHFLYGVPRLVFLTSPLAYLLFNIQIIHAQGLMIFAYAVPHVLLAITTNSRLQGRFRHSFWPEVYETVLAIFILVPTTLALINPKLGKFNVTAKGGMVDRDYFDGNIARPYYFLYLLNSIGVVAALTRFAFGNPQWTDTVALNLVWTVYNLLILGAALCVASETRQVRQSVRVRTQVPAWLRRPGSEDIIEAQTEDLSNGGLLLATPPELKLTLGETVEVALIPSSREVWTAATVRRSGSQVLALEFGELSLPQESQIVYALYGRADAWLKWRGSYGDDRPLHSLGEVTKFSLIGTSRFFRWVGQRTVELARRGLRRQVAAAVLLSLFTGLSFAPRVQAADVVPPAPATTTEVKSTDQAYADAGHSLKLEDLGQRYPLRLQTVFGQASIPVSVRRDQVVTKARLHVLYSHSPSLIPNLSHLNVLINDELQVTLPLDAASASGAEKVIDLNPALFGEFNQLRFEAVQHYTTDCEDPAYTSLWSIVSNRSYLELSYAPLTSAPALGVLPRPFFDAADQRPLRLPVSFASTGVGKEAYTAAAIMASWFGAQADYRGAEFPVRIGVLPQGYGVVLRVGSVMADQLGPAAQTPRLRVIANPAQPQARLLLLEAPDEAGLVMVAQALALGAYATSGDIAEIRSIDLPKEVARDASPHWADPDLPLPLKNLMGTEPLTVEGLTPAPMNLKFRLPPDIYFYRQDGATLELRYRYSPATAAGSSLNLFLNDGLVGASVLNKAGQVSSASTTQVADQIKLYLPASRFGLQNDLSMQYIFRRNVSKACEDFNVRALVGGIDPDSTLHFQHFAHYALWPDLGRLREGGLPFATYADLSHSAFLVPDAADEDALSALLTVSGHLGHVTGMSALRLTVDTVANASSYSDRDLLLIGRSGQTPELAEWQDRLPLQFGTRGAELRSYGAVARWQAMVEGRDLPGALKFAGRVLSGAGRTMGAIMGTSSPYGHGHAAVVITAGDQGRLAEVANALVDPALSQFVQGDLSLVVNGQVSGYQFETQYGIGSLPWYYVIQHWFYLHPYLVGPLSFVFAALAAMLAYVLLRRRAQRRLKKA
ncbi:MAG: hypothetical protein JWR07_42 [Nevskia sp.]|nr:hypothetical protein [Nevskia sp.]